MMKKSLSFVLVLLILFWTFAPAVILAEAAGPAAPTPPPAPAAPEAPAALAAPTVPEPPPAPPPPPPPPSAPASPSQGEPTSASETDPSTIITSPTTSSTPSPDSASATSSTTSGSQPVGVTQNGQTGQSVIKTESATNTAGVVTAANTNIAGAPASSSPVSAPSTIANIGNGTDSTSNASATTTSTSDTSQTNSGGVSNTLAQKTVTGGNEASQNGGGAFISTGDANVTGTAVTALNTNIAGVSVSEFNIADNHNGDIILDFAANCVSGCAAGSTTVANLGNGAQSESTATADASASSNTFQSNDGTVGNNLTLTADSGANQTNQNTGGDSVVKTGDASVSGNALTFLNNNLSGDIIYGVVNIFGNLVGDIILPNEALASAGPAADQVVNMSNGANSTNNAGLSQSSTSNVAQDNTAQINNNLDLSASTGNNTTSQNTGGDAVVKTGDSEVTAGVLNVANSNIEGGPAWLVLVNNDGVWSGQILGADPGVAFAGSSAMTFNVGPNGDVNVTNSGNGAGSANSASSTSSTVNNLNQSNNGRIENNLNLTANTGGNSASKNTGGDSFIQTGDAKIIANIVNFVNNNISVSGKLIVTVVNVFGSWVGDFVTPGTHKDKPATPEPSSPRVEAGQGGPAPANNTATPPPADPNPSQNLPSDPTSQEENTVLEPVLQGTRQALGSVRSLFTEAREQPPAPDLSAATVSIPRRHISVNLAWLVLLLPLLTALGYPYRNRQRIAYRLRQGGFALGHVGKGAIYLLLLIPGILLKK